MSRPLSSQLDPVVRVGADLGLESVRHASHNCESDDKRLADLECYSYPRHRRHL